MQARTIIAAAIASGIAVSVQAQQTFEPIVVTATRTAQTVDETLASVTVITREEIERLQPAQLSDLLQSRAGIHIASNGPFGKNSSLFLRGSNSGHTLLLIDGVRMGSATSGGAAWELLPVSEIERIEIVRGPRASVYGADAIGGVIQIFTRQGSEGAARFNAHARAGSFNTREVGAGVRGGTAKTRWSLSANHQRTDGINIQDDSGDDGRDGYRNRSLSWNLNHQLDNSAELFTSALYSQGKSDFDADQWGVGPYDSAHHDFVHAAFKAGVRASLHERWFSEFSLARSRDESDTYHENLFDSRFNTRRDQVDWRNDFSLGPSTLLTLGVDWQREQVDSTTAYDETRRDNRALYQVVQSELGRHHLQGSLRHDDNEAYGGHTTGQVAWGYALGPRLRSHLSWSTAFKAPTFNQLYWPDTGFGGGNPQLEPEESETVEAGLRYSGDGHYADISLFQTEVDNLIAGWPAENIARARMQGIELEAGLTLAQWRLAAALSYLDHQDLDTGNELVRRPRETLRLDVDRRIGAWGLGGSVIAQGGSYDNVANTVRLPGHGRLNLRTSWQAAPEWTVRASVDNALDKEYQTAAGYNQPGRAYYLSVHYQP